MMDRTTEIVARDLRFTLERMDELNQAMRRDPIGYKLGDGGDGTIIVRPDDRLLNAYWRADGKLAFWREGRETGHGS